MGSLTLIAPPGAPPVPPSDAIAESNHRIANNLAMVAGLVRLHARGLAAETEPLDNGKVRLLLEEIGGRIDSIAHLHSLLARRVHGTPIDAVSYLQEISDAIATSLVFAGKADVTYDCPGPCLLPPERALTLGLIVSELVTNAIKYAHPSGLVGHIAVGCRNVNGAIHVEVADDGVGLPEGFEPARNGGLGMRLIRSLAAQLKAKLTFDNSSVGLSVQLKVPRLAVAPR
jgi:two-component sensor histidine kinase